MNPIIVVVCPCGCHNPQQLASYINSLVNSTSMYSPGCGQPQWEPRQAPQFQQPFQQPQSQQQPFQQPSSQQSYTAVPGAGSVPPWFQTATPGASAGAPTPVPPPMYNPDLFVKKCYEAQPTDRQGLEKMKESLAAQLKQIDETLAAVEKAQKK